MPEKPKEEKKEIKSESETKPYSFNPADGKMTVINGSSAYVVGPYSVLQKRLPMEGNPMGYIRLMELEIKKEDKLLLTLVLSQEMVMKGFMPQITYFLEKLENNKESFTIQTYPTYPDNHVLCVAAIEYGIKYEKDVLGGVDVKDYEQKKKDISNHIMSLYPNAKFLNFKKTTTSFIIFDFEPDETYYRHRVGCAYDFHNNRYYFLTSIKSLEKVLMAAKKAGTKIIISEENLSLVLELFKMTAINSYATLVLNDNKALMESPYFKGAIKKEVEQKIQHLSIKVPVAEKHKIIFYTVAQIYPSNISEWTISDSEDKITVIQKIIMDNFYMPEYVFKDPVSPEDGLSYIR